MFYLSDKVEQLVFKNGRDARATYDASTDKNAKILCYEGEIIKKEPDNM